MEDRQRPGIPEWRTRVNFGSPELTFSTCNRILKNQGIPKRYLDADLAIDFPKFSETFAPDKSYYLYGKTGCGKTRMLCAMLKERSLARRNGIKTCLFISVSDMLRQIKSAFDADPDEAESNVDSLVTQMQEVDILALDDIGAEKITDWTLGEIYAVINHRYNEMLVTYIASNYTIKELGTELSDRIASRIIGMGDIIFVGKKDKREQGK
jgi:DNA replication protein DnaC